MIHEEIASGSKTNRSKIIKNITSRDTLIICKLDRWGGSLEHLTTLVNNLLGKKISLKSINNPIDISSTQSKFVFNILASLAEVEKA